MNRTTKNDLTGMPTQFEMDYSAHEQACVARIIGRKHMADRKRSERKRAQRLAAKKNRRK